MTNTMWGGRFGASPAEIMEEINASIDFDKRLWRHDIEASRAHVAMLGATGIVTPEEAEQISGGLDTILAEMEAGAFTFTRALEDIHLNIESRLARADGPVAGKLHTARRCCCHLVHSHCLLIVGWRSAGSLDRDLGKGRQAAWGGRDERRSARRRRR